MHVYVHMKFIIVLFFSVQYTGQFSSSVHSAQYTHIMIICVCQYLFVLFIVLFIVDVQVKFDEFRQSIVATFGPKTIVITNPGKYIDCIYTICTVCVLYLYHIWNHVNILIN